MADWEDLNQHRRNRVNLGRPDTPKAPLLLFMDRIQDAINPVIFTRVDLDLQTLLRGISALPPAGSVVGLGATLEAVAAIQQFWGHPTTTDEARITLVMLCNLWGCTALWTPHDAFNGI